MGQLSYSALDMAVILCKKNLGIREECQFLLDFWRSERRFLEWKYQSNKRRFLQDTQYWMHYLNDKSSSITILRISLRLRRTMEHRLRSKTIGEILMKWISCSKRCIWIWLSFARQSMFEEYAPDVSKVSPQKKNCLDRRKNGALCQVL